MLEYSVLGTEGVFILTGGATVIITLFEGGAKNPSLIFGTLYICFFCPS